MTQDDKNDLADLLDSETWQFVEKVMHEIVEDRQDLVAKAARTGCYVDAALHQGHIDAMRELRLRLLKLAGANNG
jgi:hypothetical protein